jgi:serine/threonine-protein kinase
VVLWQALTNERLIKGEHLAEVAHNILNQKLLRPSELAEVPKAIDDIVMRALERDPDNRFPDATRRPAGTGRSEGRKTRRRPARPADG